VGKDVLDGPVAGDAQGGEGLVIEPIDGGEEVGSGGVDPIENGGGGIRRHRLAFRVEEVAPGRLGEVPMVRRIGKERGGWPFPLQGVRCSDSRAVTFELAINPR
jgi:hypothetical protein